VRADAESNGQPIAPNLLGLTDVFVRYGNITLGGGSATIAVLRRELLDRRAAHFALRTICRAWA
jgi:chromate transport protein ChrA